jgi:hypothetical protein
MEILCQNIVSIGWWRAFLILYLFFWLSFVFLLLFLFRFVIWTWICLAFVTNSGSLKRGINWCVFTIVVYLQVRNLEQGIAKRSQQAEVLQWEVTRSARWPPAFISTILIIDIEGQNQIR